MSNAEFDLVVIGAGPGGYVAAIRAAQLGMKTACIEQGCLGGTCLNIGCVPSKALLDSSQQYFAAKHSLSKHGVRFDGLSVDLGAMMFRKQEIISKLTGGIGMLFKKNKVERVEGRGEIIAAGQIGIAHLDGKTSSVTATRTLIATGSVPIQIPGIAFDSKDILSSTEALSLTDIPARMTIVGGGYIGVEMASVWSRLGTDVTVLEISDRILPSSDAEMALSLQKLLEKQGIKFRFQTVVESAAAEDGQVLVNWARKNGSESMSESVDKLLISVGRRPATNGLRLAEIGIVTDEKGFIQVDERFETTLPGIYAIGDVIGGIMLAHKAEEEGVAAVEIMAGRLSRLNYDHCPMVVYTHPELASVGLTEEQARSRGDIKVGKFPFIANGRARSMNETDGGVKIIADAGTDRILGVHILGAHAGDLIAEAVMAIELNASSSDIAQSFHAHPTLPEAIKEAALAVDKRAIHI